MKVLEEGLKNEGQGVHTLIFRRSFNVKEFLVLPNNGDAIAPRPQFRRLCALHTLLLLDISSKEVRNRAYQKAEVRN